MITLNEKNNSQSAVTRFFTDPNAVGFYEWQDWCAEQGLERLVFKVSVNPHDLQDHLERIYYCFQEQLDDQLFGALSDLLIVLNTKGKALAKRMIAGSQSRLSQERIKVLRSYIDNQNAQNSLLLNNRYSVFTQGLESVSILLELQQAEDEKAQDPLVIARDHIEFSQIDDAIMVLEQAVLAEPERLALHHELLLLYRSTLSMTEFSAFYAQLLDRKITLPAAWTELNEFFYQPEL